MAEKLTKLEWENKIHTFALESGYIIKPDEIWYRIGPSGMRLSEVGFAQMNRIGIEFHKYDCIVKAWTGSLIVGLSHIPSPYYLHANLERNKPYHYDFYISDDEYAMLLMFAGNDLELFAKGF